MALKNLFVLTLLVLVASCAKNKESAADTPTTEPGKPEVSVPNTPPVTGSVVGEKYRKKYVLKSASQKLVDNRGNGFDALYGARNVRAVLNGVYYRGGANNLYNKHGSRSNSNPLPDEGLDNLCKEGFGEAVYLYPTNYSGAPHSVNCKQGHLDYQQTSILLGGTKPRKALEMIQSHIKNPSLGPIYAHCWNGWHASGFLAAVTLKQYCGFNNAQAVAYWNLNTDNNDGASYNPVRKMIEKFERFDDLTITAEEKAALCPNPNTLTFAQ